MKNIIFAILISIFNMNTALALEVVYPKKQNVKINSKSSFFIGNANFTEKLTINGVEVPVVENGGFAFPVKLNEGINEFKLQSGQETLTYTIIRPIKDKTTVSPPAQTINIPTQTFKVINDGAALRQTPIDSGINRLAQLPCNTKLIITKKRGNFLGVKLFDNKEAWILEKDVEQFSQKELKPVKIKKLKCKKNEEYIQYRFKLKRQVPFAVLNQNKKLILRFYNIKKSGFYEFIPEIENIIGYDYYYETPKHFILNVRYKMPEKKTIVIDAGHGGYEKGAIGCCGDYEKDINLQISKYLKEELQKNFNVIMTREDDTRLSLQERVDIAKQNNAQILISVHANALPDCENPLLHRGTSVYYYHVQAKPLAESILKSVTEIAKTNNDKVRQRSLALVRPTKSISILIETAYMINPQDNTLLLDSTFQKNCAKGIAEGIKNYLTKFNL